MTKFKKIATLGIIAVVIGATSIVALASSAFNTPAEAVAGLTGRSVESIIAEKNESGKTYGAIAKEAGKLEEFKAENLEMKKDILSKKVAEGTMTQEKADEIIAALQENQANCDGTGSAKIGKGQGAGFGKANGQGKRQGGARQGQKMRNGSCQAQ